MSGRASTAVPADQLQPFHGTDSSPSTTSMTTTPETVYPSFWSSGEALRIGPAPIEWPKSCCQSLARQK
jgi:hypothetical protein